MPLRGTCGRPEGTFLLPFRRRGNVFSPSTGRFGHVFGPDWVAWSGTRALDEGAHRPTWRAWWQPPTHPAKDRKRPDCAGQDRRNIPKANDGTDGFPVSRRHRIGLDSPPGVEAPWTPMTRHFPRARLAPTTMTTWEQKALLQATRSSIQPGADFIICEEELRVILT